MVMHGNTYRVILDGSVPDDMPILETWKDALAYALRIASDTSHDVHVERRLSALTWACEGHQIRGRGWDFGMMTPELRAERFRMTPATYSAARDSLDDPAD